MLNTILNRLGHHPTSTTTARTTYKTPFNPNEKTPSFCVFPNNNGEWKNFKDYSSGEGGDIYKFLMQYFNIGFVEAKEKLNELLGEAPKEYTPPPQQSPSHSSFNQQKKSYKILKIQPLQNKALINYLNNRGIKYFKDVNEIYYELNEKRYFAISFMNNSGGVEVRNEYFKGAFGDKDITTIAPTKEKHTLRIFEGFIDYLSYLQLDKTAPKSDYLILNSVSMLNKAKNALNRGYEVIELYLDNDDAGEKATIKIKELVTGIEIIDKRDIYKGYKDLNECLTKDAGGQRWN